MICQLLNYHISVINFIINLAGWRIAENNITVASNELHK
jgi:hypothetical protein